MDGLVGRKREDVNRVSENVYRLVGVMAEMDRAIADNSFNALPDGFFTGQLNETVLDIQENGVGQYEDFISKCHVGAQTAEEKQIFIEMMRFVKSIHSKLRCGGIAVSGRRVKYL